MKRVVTLLFVMVLMVSADVEVLDVDYKSKEKFLNEDYVLNGAGIRDKFIFDIYTIGLYVKEKSTSGSVILNSDANKYVRIVIVSRLVTAERFSDGLDDGFEKSTEGNTAPIKKEIELVRKGFGADFEKGDEFIIFFITLLLLFGPPYIIARVPFIAPISPPLTGASKNERFFEINLSLSATSLISSSDVVE